MSTFGIDLGTTYSCVARIDETGRPVIVKNRAGEDTTPSVVYFETPDNVVVGESAKKASLLEPHLAVSLVKRQMGQRFDLEFHGQRHTAQSISALILREMAEAASELTHEPVKDVVITVPAYFGVAERQATEDAGKIAGLNVLALVPEPVAAALHYGAMDSGGVRTILVYDLGGGTFDTTVIRLDGGDVTVVCTDGDHQLGGADWDERIADHLLKEYLAASPGSDAAGDEEFLQEVALAAEELKKELSSMQSRRRNLRFDGVTQKLELSREKFEEVTLDLLDKTVDITRRTIATAKSKGVDRFDEVLLVGGSVRMPAVGARLRAEFGFEPKLHDPDLAVAKGAALYALIESVKICLPDGGEAGEQAVAEASSKLGIEPEKIRMLAGRRITSVVPRAFGVKVLDDVRDGVEYFAIDHVLMANTALPAEPRQKPFHTAYPNQTEIKVEIWEQAGAVESERLEDNGHIGEGLITGLPPLPQHSPITISFAMDEMGLLRVHAVEEKTGNDLTIEIKIEGLSAEEVSEARSTVARLRTGE